MSVSMTKSVLIDAPIEEVIVASQDIEQEPTWWPDMLESEVLETDEEGRATRARFVNEVAKVGRDEFELGFSYRDDGSDWNLVKTSMMQKKQVGAWALEAEGDSTKATLSLEIDTSLPMPGFLQKRILDSIVKGALSGLKKYCES